MDARLEFRTARLVLQSTEYTLHSLADKVIEIQQTIYESELVEQRTIFEHILLNWPELCLFAIHDNQIIGHLLAHPWPAKSYPPRLNSIEDILGITPIQNIILTSPLSIFIHDLTIIPEMKTRGLGKQLYNMFESTIMNRHNPVSLSLSLVSVQGSCKFWEKQGFNSELPSPILPTQNNTHLLGQRKYLCNNYEMDINDVLGSYGDTTAILMTKYL